MTDVLEECAILECVTGSDLNMKQLAYAGSNES